MSEPTAHLEKQMRTDLRVAAAMRERMPRSRRSESDMRRLEDNTKRRIDETAKRLDL